MLKTERRWVPVDSSGVDETGMQEAIIAGSPCPICNDRRSRYLPVRGEKHGVLVSMGFTCSCIPFRRFRNLMEGTPSRFSDARLATLKTLVARSTSDSYTTENNRSGEGDANGQLLSLWSTRHRQNPHRHGPLRSRGQLPRASGVCGGLLRPLCVANHRLGAAQ